MIVNNCLCELIDVNDLIHINQFAQTVIHSKLMCESMDPFTRQMFPPTTVEEIEHMSPEQIGNSSPAEAPLVGQRF